MRADIILKYDRDNLCKATWYGEKLLMLGETNLMGSLQLIGRALLESQRILTMEPIA